MNSIDASLADYRIEEAQTLMTPALAICADAVDHNIRSTLRVLGDVNRWRPHIKTVKLAYVIRRLVDYGVENMKCATTLELLTACEAGARDVLLAYPLPAPAAARTIDIAAAFPNTTISALIENPSQISLWAGTSTGLFIDLNSGMNRTGMQTHDLQQIIAIAREILRSGLRFRGLHYYEGHLTQADLTERTIAAHAGYNVLMSIVDALQSSGIDVEEVITSGTPALPCALAYEPFRSASFVHRVSPGTIVYNDWSSLEQLPAEYGFRPAAVVLTSVVSNPAPDLATCDAGHKTVSADAGMPNCAVIGNASVQPLRPSEEHLPLRLSSGSSLALGSQLYLVPKHVCPTVNNFDHALIVRGGRVVAIEAVTARGRELPMRHSSQLAVSL